MDLVCYRVKIRAAHPKALAPRPRPQLSPHVILEVDGQVNLQQLSFRHHLNHPKRQIYLTAWLEVSLV
jgi:hypothetical protein